MNVAIQCWWLTLQLLDKMAATCDRSILDEDLHPPECNNLTARMMQEENEVLEVCIIL
jgi:hypothetical protein